MLARDKNRLSNLENEIPNSKAFSCDVSNLLKLKYTCKQVKNLMGPPEILIHNAVKRNFEKLPEDKPK